MGSPNAESILAEFLSRREHGESVDIEQLCAEHPERAEGLRQLHADWQGVGAELDVASDIPADAADSVYTSGENSEDAAWQRFIEQLKSRGPGHSRYVFKDEVAQGGMGVIHRVYDQDVRRYLAMKVILGKEGQRGSSKAGDTPDVDSRSLGRFLEEAQVTGQLDHPGIVPVHELGVDESDRVYFTMKLVKGEDLRSVFERVHDPNDDGWNPTRALSLLLRVCEAMAYAHSKGVIHRDLKPSNIMVGKYGETYVMDWGLARVLGKKDQKDLRIRPDPGHTSTAVKSHRKGASGTTPDSPLITMDGDVVGTPAYMSPEQARGELDRIGPQSDVYALGAMLYHLLAGHMPYVHPGLVANQHAIWKWVQQGPPEPMHKVAKGSPAELVAICDKAMSRTMASRYGDMEELAVDLRAYLEHRVVAAYESGAIAELKKWVKRNKGITATAAAAVVVIAALTGWFVVSVRASEETALEQRDRADDNARIAEANEDTAIEEKQRADENAEQARLNAEESRRNADLAEQRADEAEAERERAQAEKDRVLRLSDVKGLLDLKSEMADLWPAHPQHVPAMETWLEKARKLIGNLPLHEQTLADIRTRGTPVEHPLVPDLAEMKTQLAALREKAESTEEGEERTQFEAGVAKLVASADTLSATIQREQPYEFSEAQDGWWHDTLVSLVSDLVAFSAEDPFGDTVTNMEDRLRFAQTIEKNSIMDYQDEWAEALASIADLEECPKYGGLEIKEQLGLVPIGRDPESGLWEFWHVQTGEKPVRNEDGKLVLTEEMSLVFVLIPGGTFWMGAQASDPEGQNFDPEAKVRESKNGRPVELALDPYFLSKYEMTQGQWHRLAGENPSYYAAGRQLAESLMTLSHPIEQVSWEDCSRALGRLGLRLPTEAQWESSCRAGSTTVYATGDEIASLSGFANIADEGARDAYPSGWPFDKGFFDGYDVHAPVGSLNANAYGLHDMHGNVWEWSLDGYGRYATVASQGDGERNVQGALSRVTRGGSFDYLAAMARAALRRNSPQRDLSGNQGVRPARVITTD